MAARRVAKSSVDWSAYFSKTPAYQVDSFRALKAKNESFVAKVNSLPESLPNIDWAHYRKRVPVSGLVDKFEKAYTGTKLPYPEDNEGWQKLIDEQDKYVASLMERSKAANANLEDSARRMLGTVDKLPPLEEMTYEHMAAFFPGKLQDPDNPTDSFPFIISRNKKKYENETPI